MLTVEHSQLQSTSCNIRHSGCTCICTWSHWQKQRWWMAFPLNQMRQYLKMIIIIIIINSRNVSHDTKQHFCVAFGLRHIPYHIQCHLIIHILFQVLRHCFHVLQESIMHNSCDIDWQNIPITLSYLDIVGNLVHRFPTPVLQSKAKHTLYISHW